MQLIKPIKKQATKAVFGSKRVSVPSQAVTTDAKAMSAARWASLMTPLSLIAVVG